MQAREKAKPDRPYKAARRTVHRMRKQKGGVTNVEVSREASACTSVQSMTKCTAEVAKVPTNGNANHGSAKSTGSNAWVNKRPRRKKRNQTMTQQNGGIKTMRRNKKQGRPNPMTCNGIK